ncbi:MAG: hypothetical protein JOS17DRAFT_304196 [Linnemannia elongata]|nr:MAG: hypothetical protein JOS17DRAFT_304196 [Linnemannia elongata]
MFFPLFHHLGLCFFMVGLFLCLSVWFARGQHSRLFAHFFFFFSFSFPLVSLISREAYFLK